MVGLIILITAETCSHCIKFKETQLPKLESLLSKNKNLKLLHINFKSTSLKGDGDNEKVNEISFMKNLIYSFPSIYYIDEVDFNNKNNKKIYGFGLIISNGELSINSEGNVSYNKVSRDADTIYKWALELYDSSKPVSILNRNVDIYRLVLAINGELLLDNNININLYNNIMNKLKGNNKKGDYRITLSVNGNPSYNEKINESLYKDIKNMV